MSEQTTVAESSPAIAVESGPMVNWSSDQRAEFRRTGNMPEAPKKVEAPAASGTEQIPTSETEKVESAGETEAPKPQQEQQRKGKGAEQRIMQLLSETKSLRAELDALKSKPVEPPKAAQQVEPPRQQYTRAKPTLEDKSADGKTLKYATYEDFVEDLADWRAEQRWAQSQAQQAQQIQQREVAAKVSDAKTRYADFDQKSVPFVKSFVEDGAIPFAVKAVVSQSEVWPDLVYTIASDQKESAHFLEMARTDWGKAIRYVALTESLIREELESAGKKTAPATQTPAKTQTAAPKPPSEVGGRSAAPPDALESAAKANDFRSFKTEANRRDLARLRA